MHSCEENRRDRYTQEESEGFQEVVNDRIEEFTDKFNRLADEYTEKPRPQGKPFRVKGRRRVRHADMRSLKISTDRLGMLYSRSGLPDADLDSVEERINAFMEVIPTLWPVEGRITDRFGYRKDPFTGRKRSTTVWI